MPQIPPEREQPFEVPWREKEHQPPDDAVWSGNLSDGHVTFSSLPYNLTLDEAEAMHADLLERERRRIPCGFRA